MEQILFLIVVLSSLNFKPVITLCPTGCANCVNGSNNCINCNTGYFKVTSGELSNCSPCPPSCNSCFNTTYCTLCNDDYFIRSSINETNGNGQTQCIACTDRLCSQCSDRMGLKSCESCGYPNMTEEKVCKMALTCKSSCIFGCDDSSYCVDGCINGYAGRLCYYRCHDNCLQCKQSNQELCESCRDGFYSQSCSMRCPTNCRLEQYPTCRVDDGFCLNGCNAGFWGNHCNNECSNHCLSINNMSDTCDRDGSCLHGCIDGYFGSNCDENYTYMITPSKKEFTTLSSSTYTSISSTQRESSTREVSVSNCQEGSSISGSVLGGAVTGAVLITALLIGSIALFLHRRLASKSESKRQ